MYAQCTKQMKWPHLPELLFTSLLPCTSRSERWDRNAAAVLLGGLWKYRRWCADSSREQSRQARKTEHWLCCTITIPCVAGCGSAWSSSLWCLPSITLKSKVRMLQLALPFRDCWMYSFGKDWEPLRNSPKNWRFPILLLDHWAQQVYKCLTGANYTALLWRQCCASPLSSKVHTNFLKGGGGVTLESIFLTSNQMKVTILLKFWELAVELCSEETRMWMVQIEHIRHRDIQKTLWCEL